MTRAVISSVPSTLDVKFPVSTEIKQKQRIGTGVTKTENPSQAAPITINSGRMITPRYGGW